MKNKKIVKEAMIFLLILLLCILFVNSLYYSYILKNKLLYRQVEEFDKFIENRTEINILFIGDSFTHYSMDPKFFSSSFNYAANSDTYIENYYTIKNVLEREIKVNTVVIQIAEHSFSDIMIAEGSSMSRSLWHYHKIVPISVLKDVTGYSYPEIMIFSHFPFIQNGKDFFVGKKEMSEQILGWQKGTADFSKMNMELEARRTAEGHFYKRIYPEKKLISNYVKLLELLKANNVKVIFVKYPVSCYYHNYTQIYNLSFFYDQQLWDITKQYFPNPIIYDYTYFTENMSLFLDPDHLNYLGSSQLSKKFYEDVQNQNNLSSAEKYLKFCGNIPSGFNLKYCNIKFDQR